MSRFRITAEWTEGTIPIPRVHAAIDVTFEDITMDWRQGEVDMRWRAAPLQSLRNEVATRELLEFEIRPLTAKSLVPGRSVQRSVNLSDPELLNWVADFVSKFGAPLSVDWATARPETLHAHDLRRFVSDLLDLQRCATHLLAVSKGETTATAWAVDDEDKNALNFARTLSRHLEAFHPRLVVIDEHERVLESQPFSIVNALAAQIFNSWIEEEIPFKTCPVCGAQFQRQRGRSRGNQHRTTGVIYCSLQCGRNKANRDYRARSRRKREQRKE